MPRLPSDPARPLLFLGGAVLGAFSWFAASVVSGTFEPYDSGVGLLVNQAILSASAAMLAWYYRLAVPFLCMAGAYLGMNAYVYGFGGSEPRVWAALGAVVSTVLFLVPVLFALGAVAVRRLLRRPLVSEATRPQAGEE